MRIFVIHTAPKSQILKYNLSIAACNFSYTLIEGNKFDRVYSILPAFVKGEVEPFEGLVYSKFRKNRFFFRLAPIVENLNLFYKIPRKASVWYYNCTTLNAFLIVLLKLFKPNVRQNLIILDYTPSRKPLERFFLWLANRMDGTIRLANSPLFTCRNSVCLPGVVPLYATEQPKITTITKTFLISGVLEDNIAMLPMMLEAFSEMPEMQLHITGKAPDLILVNQYTQKHKNIIYHGLVEYDEYLYILHNTTFLLSTRNPNMPENQCNFPSKIIEALLHNRIVISTLYYEQLKDIKYLKVASNVNDFIRDIKYFTCIPKNELLKYANQSRLIKDKFNTEIWNLYMSHIENNLINKIREKDIFSN